MLIVFVVSLSFCVYVSVRNPVITMYTPWCMSWCMLENCAEMHDVDLSMLLCTRFAHFVSKGL